jgi:hypothetical protein
MRIQSNRERKFHTYVNYFATISILQSLGLGRCNYLVKHIRFLKREPVNFSGSRSRVAHALTFFILSLPGQIFAQQTIFSQDFTSSTSVTSYISATPAIGQFDAITTAGTNTVSISGNALHFTRGNNTSSFTRSTNFSPTPTALVYAFDITVSGTTGNTNSAATFQVGDGYSSATNGVETNANTYAQMQVDFRGIFNFRFRDISNGNVSSNFSVGTTYTVTWVMNNSGSTLTYTAPDGSTQTVGNDLTDIWVGNTLIFNGVNIETTTSALNDLKFAFTGGSGNIDIANINIYSINPFITSQPSNVTVCQGSSASLSVTASGTSLSYQWKKGSTNLTNGGNISGATNSTLTLNPIAVADAAANYNVVVTSSGGYTAGSNNTTITVNPSPTDIAPVAVSSSICNGSSTNIQIALSQLGVNYQLRNNASKYSSRQCSSGQRWYDQFTDR